MDHKYCAKYFNVELCPVVRQEIENLRIWRNDKEATKYLRPIPEITSEMQAKWFEDYLKDENQICFAIEETKDLNRMVGSLSLYDFDYKNKVCEIGKIQIGDPEAHGKGIGRYSFVMAMKIAVEMLHMEKIIAEVHRDNIAARTNYFKIGFRIVGEQPSVAGGMEDKLEITAEEIRNIDYYHEIVILCLNN